MAGTGTGGGSAVRILNGWVDLRAHLELLAVKRVAAFRDLDIPVKDRSWNEGTIMGESRERANRVLHKVRGDATTKARVSYGKERIRMSWIKRCKSKTAQGLMAVAGTRRMARCMMGKPIVRRKPIKGQSRADWKRVLSVAANVSPSPSSAGKGEGPQRVLANLTIDEDLKREISRRCPLCSATTEVDLLWEILERKPDDEEEQEMIRKWVQEQALGSAAHIIGECSKVDRGPKWSRWWEAAKSKTEYLAIRSGPDGDWYNERPILELQQLILWEKEEIWEGLKKGLQALGEV
ncbi:hypothetical protein J8273_5621 [Carpediemonas membranifera]|uniref:Uncharacterized protein n=1 Tax=Carpediemonas membranifera TaxID=201153 RepID=A0A8J6AUT6_9EUKA|nr:hypothetical protein J8273_5621 [Carpediemonas membranifera]|eukprot:KAG9393035.1 hypothetical protein J8273_5621 [Carpediemonas membranifera]